MGTCDEEAAWDAASTWARSGVMALCGHPDGPPVLPPLCVPPKLSAVVDEIELRTASRGRPVRLSWEAALAGRAALMGLTRQGTWSANRTCRLLEAMGGEVALNLPRPDDIEMIPALTGTGETADYWAAVSASASASRAEGFVGLARLLGLAAAVPAERGPAASPYQLALRANPRVERADDPWTVVDLSSLWAGPLTARVLAEAGARVVKVEDPSRPDGARRSPAFFSWLQPSSARTEQLEFKSASGQRRLAELFDTADVVIEASRPRALEQIGFSPDQRSGPDGQVWLSITAHGRAGEARNWTGYGDDAAIAGGLACRDSEDRAVFCGDAIADPITGLTGALAVLRCLDEGGGQLIDISLSGTAAWFAAGDLHGHDTAVRRTGRGWTLFAGNHSEPISERPDSLRLVINS